MLETCPKCGSHITVADCCRVTIRRLRQQLADVDYLDDAARRFGTRLDIPPQIPGIDEDHMHFVLMPIGAAARRAAVAWLKSQAESGESLAAVEVDWARQPAAR